MGICTPSDKEMQGTRFFSHSLAAAGASSRKRKRTMAAMAS